MSMSARRRASDPGETARRAFRPPGFGPISDAVVRGPAVSSVMNKVTNAIQRHPLGAFVAFLALHAAVWTALPAILFQNLPLDLIEARLYGREWQLGYDKLPPLPWWLVEAAYRLFGADIAYYALSQIAVVSAFALVWHMGRQLVGPVPALVAVLIIDGLHYFTFTAPKFNHGVVQLPFWALAGYAYWAALRRGRMLHWLLLGFAVGMALWAKYFVAVLVLPLLLFLLFDRHARKFLATPGPYVAAGVAILVAAPHLVWLVQNHFPPLDYVESRAKPFHGAVDYLWQPGEFLISQLAFLLPAFVIAAPFQRRDMPWPNDANPGEFPRFADAFDRRIVTLLAFGPTVTLVLLSVVTA